MTAIPLSSVASLAPAADVWFVDIWGVLHNGVKPYARAVEACETFRARGGTVILVSNAPRPRTSVSAQLHGIGVRATAYDAIVSSGDVSRQFVSLWAGRRVMHIGPPRDVPLFEGTGVTPDAGASNADVVVCTGLYDDEAETPADYASLLAELRARGIPMICANPDRTVERGGRIVYCAGAIVAAYEALGGAVSYAGKPFLPIYEAASSLAAEVRAAAIGKDRILAIGDGVATDIAGASRFGIRSVFVASGVHVGVGEDLERVASELFPENDTSRPIAVMPALAW